MDKSNLTLLRCPYYLSGLEADIEEANDDEVLWGKLTCPTCTRSFAVKQGIPLLWLSDEECVSRNRNRYKDFVIDPATIEVWRCRERDDVENDHWLKIQSLRRFKWPALLVGAAALVLLGIGGLFGPPHLILLGVLALTAAALPVVLFWYHQLRHQYAIRHNFFVDSTRKFVELYTRQEVSERAHFGGGEQVFSDWSGAVEAGPEVGSAETRRKQAEQEEFVARKSRYLDRFFDRKGLKADISRWEVLCLGCGSPVHQEVNRFFHRHGGTLWGVDTQDYSPLSFSWLFDAQGILGNAMAIPVADDTFDCVVFTDVLEHVHDPLGALKEIRRVLKWGGHLVLTTNCRHPHHLVINPLTFGTMMLGKRFPNLLPGREVIQEWDGKVFYHTEFARAELVEMLRMAGFRSFELKTNNFFSPPEQARRFKARWCARLGLGEEFFLYAVKS